MAVTGIVIGLLLVVAGVLLYYRWKIDRTDKTIQHFKDMNNERKKEIERWEKMAVVLATLLLTLAGCGPATDRSEEARAWEERVVMTAYEDLERSLAMVDSAEHAGLFSTMRANVVRACIYNNVGQTLPCSHYARLAVDDPEAASQPDEWQTARLILADAACVNGNYDESLRQCTELRRRADEKNRSLYLQIQEREAEE